MSLRSISSAAAALALLCISVTAPAGVDFRPVSDAVTDLAATNSYPYGFYRYGDEVFFTATSPVDGTELFATDPRTGNTRLVADLAPHGASSWAQVLGDVGGRLIVGADVGNVYSGFFSRRDRIISLDPVSGAYTDLMPFDVWSPLFARERFTRAGQFPGVVAFRNLSDDSIWATNGTPEATQRIYPDTIWPPVKLCAMSDRFVFSRNTASQAELWISNGYTLGTGTLHGLPGAKVLDQRGHDGACYFLATDERSGLNVWRSDGTASGTSIVDSVPAHAPGRLYPLGPQNLLVLGTVGADESKLFRLGESEPLWSASPAAPSGEPAFFGAEVAIGLGVGGQTQLLLSDGTAAGTRLAQYDGSPRMPWREASLSPGDGYLVVTDNQSGTVYRVDTETAQVSALPDSPLQYQIDQPVETDGVLIGPGGDDVIGSEVWRSDGTPGGTYPLADVAQSTRSGALDVVAAATSRDVLLYASLDDRNDLPDPRHSLWRSDGTAAGTFALPRVVYRADDDVVQLGVLDDAVLFVTRQTSPTSGGRLYRTDADFSQIALLWQQTGAIYSLTQTDHAVFFDCTLSNGRGLCGLRTGGQIEAILPGGTRFKILGSIGDAVLASTALGFMRSDGTTAGTTFFAPGFGMPTSDAQPSQRVATRLYFEACGSGDQNSCGLYVSDGTAAGTRLVQLLYWHISHMVAFGNGVAFATDDSRGTLWVSDGSAAGTRVVKMLGRRPTRIVTAGRYLHVTINGMSIPADYYVSDGTAAGTRQIALPGDLFVPAETLPAVLDADTVVFPCRADWLGQELCVTDAAATTVSLLGDFYWGPQSSSAGLIGKAGGSGYLSINDGRHGYELWRVTGDRIFAAGYE